MDPRILNLGDTVEHSTVGPGVVTGFYNSYPMVGGKAVGNLTRTDGAKFGVGGSLALPSAVVPTAVPAAAIGGNIFASRPLYPQASITPPVVAVVENPGSMPITTPESPLPMSTPIPVEPPVEPPVPVEAPTEAPAEAPVETPPTERAAFGMLPPDTSYVGMTAEQLRVVMAESQPPVPTEPAPEDSGLEVRPPGSMEGGTIVAEPVLEAPPVEHDSPPHVSPPDPGQAVFGEPLVAPAKSPDHGDSDE